MCVLRSLWWKIFAFPPALAACESRALNRSTAAGNMYVASSNVGERPNERANEPTGRGRADDGRAARGRKGKRAGEGNTYASNS